MRANDLEGDAPSSSPAADEPLYPLEGKFTSAKDRETILALGEIERESILAERAHEVTRRKQDLQLKRALASTKAHGAKSKRKAEEDHEDGSRRTTRPKTEKSGKSALDDYKRAREQKGTRRDADTTQSRRQESRSPSRGSDRDADGESEVEWAEPSRETRRNEPAPELRDFERCRIGRTYFSKVVYNPLFAATVKGCFCRVSVGFDRSKNQNEYRMAQIKGFTEGKAYALESNNGKFIPCDTYAMMSQGSAEKAYPFNSMSDSRIAPEEFARYERTLANENKKLPSRTFLVNKLSEIEKMIDHRWTDADIQRRLDTIAEVERRHAKPTRADLEKRKAAAEAQEDADEVKKLEAQISALENSAKATGAGQRTTPVKSKAIQEQDRLAAFNRNTRKENSERVRKAIAEEKKRQQEWVESFKREQKAKEAAAVLKREEELFGGSGSGADTPKKLPGSRQGTPANGEVRKKRDVKGLPIGSLRAKAATDDDVLGDMDLGLEIDI